MTAERRARSAQLTLAAAAIAGAMLVWLALADVQATYGRVIATFWAVLLLWWSRRVFSLRRVVLWIEERIPELRYALVALLEAPESRFRPVLEGRVREARIAPPVGIAVLRLVGIPFAFLLVMQLVVQPLLARTGIADTPGFGRSDVDAPRGADGRDGSFRAIVVTPAYARVAPDTLRNPTSIAAIVGSNIGFTGAFRETAVMPRRPTVLRLSGAAGERLVALEPRADSAPSVVLETPQRDTVLPVARGRMRLSATARDDIGITAGWFELIVSSGGGESFKFRTAVLARTAGNDARSLRWETTLDLDSLRLGAGDIVHMRAVARDANPAADAEVGSSETRTLRIPRRDENDSISIELAPPPEVGKSELSQRMLIMLTEKLVAQMRRISTGAVKAESQSIAREQGRLRKRVGQIIFQRLTGEEGEDEHVDAAMADTLSPAEALLKAASEATNIDTAHMHEAEGPDGPVVAVNRPLLEAFNSMWEAERSLGVAEPRQALPHMRAALDAIQRARAAERLYLRGRAPKIVLDVARIRLTGKRDGVSPEARTPRASAVAAKAAREARFDAALDLAARNDRSAVDSLVMLRVDVLSEQPALAAALAAAIEDLRVGRDATTRLRAARRALAGAPERSRDARWSGSW